MKLARALLLSQMEDLVLQRARDGGAWLESAVQTAVTADAFAEAFASASRHVGRGALALGVDDVARLRAVGLTWPLTRWALDDLARAALLLRAGDILAPIELAALVDRCHRDGDMREQQAVLRALPVLPHQERCLAVAIDAARAGLPPVFEAIACENPYPAAHFPALNFNHLVLRALILGTTLERVTGLGKRVTPELIRLVNEYAAERRAKGRSVPADVDYLAEAARAVAA